MKIMTGAAMLIFAYAPLASSAADAGGWNFAFNQGIAEYRVGSFTPGGSSLSLSCAEGGVAPGTVEVRVRRAHFKLQSREPVVFSVGKQQVPMFTDADGAVRYSGLEVAPRFKALWRLLRTGSTVHVKFGPGAPLSFPLTGAAKLLGPVPCPKQLAG